MMDEDATSGHQRELRSAEFSPNGNFIVTSSGALTDAIDNTARLWDVETGRQVKILGEYKDLDDRLINPIIANRAAHQGPYGSLRSVRTGIALSPPQQTGQRAFGTRKPVGKSWYLGATLVRSSEPCSARTANAFLRHPEMEPHGCGMRKQGRSSTRFVGIQVEC